MKKGTSIKVKLFLILLGVGLIPLFASIAVSYWKTSAELHEEAKSTSAIIAKRKADSIKSYFNDVTTTLVNISRMPSTVQALQQFGKPFEGADQTLTRVDKSGEAAKSIEGYLTHEFGKTYSEKNSNKKYPVADILNKMDQITVVAQEDFIVKNENPLGQKHLMTKASRSTPYAKVHEFFHPSFRSYLESQSLYDVFLVNKAGRVVYTVYKELDFATSLVTGPWANTGLANAYRKALELSEGEVHIEDFAQYTPSYEAPASFVSTPLLKDGEVIGALIVQFPLDKISAVAGGRSGLGEKGQSLLVGSDGKLRADTHRTKDTHTVAAFFAEGSNLKIDTKALDLARQGQEGFVVGNSYDDVEVLSYYLPLKIANIEWYLISELSAEETFAGLDTLTMWMVGITVIGLIAILAVAFFFGNSIASALNSISQILDNSGQELRAASTQSASLATELSESTTEQAASLQETMASVEEISAMVNQNAESAKQAKNAVDSNQKSTDTGVKNVDEMLQAISEISDTNEEILGQMESSNKEFAEIVKIITQIDEKTKVINDIVFQTKLLSFNASVEAARAGEHGKGFAVVAEEVGNLAQMSGNAAKEITEMLSSSIQKVNQIVSDTSDKIDRLVEVGKDKISVGQSTAQKCRDALSEIASNASTVAALVTEISNASSEQAQGVQEISKAMTQLDQVTQQNSAVSQQSSSQAEQLSAQSQALLEAVKALVHFVQGQSSVTGNDGAKITRLNPKSNSSVISKNKRDEMAKVNKIAAGSSDTPKFEEF